jgi:hypothetical protein
MKEISKDTENVVKTLKAYTKNGLKKENDFGQILEYCVSTGEIEVLQHFMRYGNALTKLSLKLGDSSLPEDAVILVQREFKDQLERVSSIVEHIVNSGWDKDYSDRLEQVYLDKTKGSVLNIIDLSSDFAAFKTMQTEHRETQKDS